MHLENEIWQKIPGTVNTWIYPFIRKPSITGSNTFIIKSGRFLIVIDPGAIPDQMEKTKGVLVQEISDPNHLIILVAGHIHIDHTYLGLVDRNIRDLGRVIFAAEDQGAKYLEAGDLYWTGADCVGVTIPCTPVALHLLTPEDKQTSVPRRVSVSGTDDLLLIPHTLNHNGMLFYGQSLPLTDNDRIEFWHTPGHCPDSITIRIGALYHLGDIPFAINPGIAGRPGYCRESLLYSIIGIKHLFDHDGGLICCTGHGRSLNREATLTMLNRLEQDAVAMPEISIFDEKQLNLSMWHGLDLIEEAHRIFPVIAGRIMALCFQLEELGMKKEAGEISSLFKHETVDEILDEFTQYYEEYKAGKKVKPEVVLKALQIVNKLQTSFQAASLAGIIDLSLIRRATRLFSDFLGTVHGVTPKGSLEKMLLLPLIEEFISSPYFIGISDDDLIRVADNEDEYHKALVYRIAHYSHQRRLLLRLHSSEEFPFQTPVLVDRERFMDFLAGITGYFESISAQIVDISVACESDRMLVIFTPSGDTIRYGHLVPGATLREVAYAGGTVISVMEPGKEDIRVAFPNFCQDETYVSPVEDRCR